MIPWHTFKTPQDAYEWAKANASRFAVVPWPTGWAVVGFDWPVLSPRTVLDIPNARTWGMR